MKVKVILLIVFALMTNILFGQADTDIVIGKKIQFESEILNEKRTVLIHYPDTIIDKTKRYPVLYCVDGEYRFHSTFGIVDYHSKIKQIPKMIIVSIENIDKTSRSRDMTPPDKYHVDSMSVKVNAELFLDFIELELIPFVNEKYNPLPYKVLAGHSFGGLFAGYCFLTRPELFDSFIVSDPSFWYNDWIMLKIARSNLKDKYNKKTLYLSHSQKESIQKETIKLFVEIIRKVEPSELDWTLDNIDRDHGSAFIDGISKGLLFVFKDWKDWEILK